MDREQIARDYLALGERISNEYQDRHVPHSVQTYYLLCEMISGASIGDFIQTYDCLRLEIAAANEGKQILNLGKLDDFEVSAIEILNDAIKLAQS